MSSFSKELETLFKSNELTKDKIDDELQETILEFDSKFFYFNYKFMIILEFF